MKKSNVLAAAVVMTLAVSACALVPFASGKEESETLEGLTEDATETVTEDDLQEEQEMKLTIGDTQVEVTWEENESVEELKELVSAGPLTIEMSGYGGFEQVGPIGQDLVSDDVQTVTQPGDIVLYANSRIVIFYGSNSWAYTRLGKITDRTAKEMGELLGKGDVAITLSM